MADVSRSVSLSKKLPNAGDLSYKHIYDGVFSAAPTSTKLKASTFSIRIDDYSEIFSPSDASLGSSMPVLDLPAVDRSNVIGRGRSSGVDYAGVFGGCGDDDRVGVPAEVLFRESKKKSKPDAHRSRSSMQTKLPASKSQEFPCDSGNSRAKTRTTVSKSQEFCGSSGDNPTSSQASRSPTKSRIAVSKSQEFCGSFQDNPISSHISKTPTKTGTTVSKRQEFCGDFSDNPQSSQASNSPVKTRMTLSKSQEFCGSSGDNPTSSQASRSPTKSRIAVSKSQEFCGSFQDNPISSHISKTPTKIGTTVSKCQEFCGDFSDNPQSSQASNSPVKTRMTLSKSQEFCGSSRADLTSSQASESLAETRMTPSKSQEFCSSSMDNPTSSNLPTDQQFDGIKDLSVLPQKSNQLSNDGIVDMTQVAHLPAVPGYTRMFEEVSPARKTDLSKAKRLSMDDDDFKMDLSKGKRQGKHTRAVSDLGTGQEISDHDARLHKEFGGDHTIDATHRTREVIGKSQSFNVSPLSSSPQLYGSSDYFRRSSSRRSKSSNNLRSDATTGSSSPLLELDANSTAALSAAALKRAIEEAEEKIRWAKEFLKVRDVDGSTKLTFKDSLKVKAASDTIHSYEPRGLKQNGGLEVEATRQNIDVDEDNALKQNRHLITTENSNLSKAGGLKLKDDLNCSTTESHLPDKAGMLNEELHRVSAQEGTRDSCRSTCAATTFERTQDSSAQVECATDALLLKEKANSHEVVKSTEKSHKHEGGGEWEAAKHLSQLISGVKSRLVSFMSKQADTEKIVKQEDAQSRSRSVEQSKGSTCQVKETDSHIKRETDQDHMEKDRLASFNSKHADTEKIAVQEDAPSSSGFVEQSDRSTCQVQDADACTKRSTGQDCVEKDRLESFISTQADTENIMMQEDAPGNGSVEQSEERTCQVQDVDAYTKMTTDQDHVEKDRLVSFISKQADTEKIVIQEDAPSSSGFVEQSEGSTCQVQDADAYNKRATDQDGVETDRLVSFISKQAETENIVIQEGAPSSSGFVEQSEGSTCQVLDADACNKRATDQDVVEKDRLVSFISTQADTENIMIQEDAPSSNGSVEQSEESTCQVQDADGHTKKATDQVHVEKDRLVSFISTQADTEKIMTQEDAPSSSGSVEQSELSTGQVQDADAYTKMAIEQDHVEKDRLESFISTQADTEKILIEEDTPGSSGSVEQYEGSTCQAQDADAYIKRAADQDCVEKDRLVSFSSTQADTEKIMTQEDSPSSSGSVEQYEGSTCQAQDADAYIKRAADQDCVEKDIEMNYHATSGVGEIVQHSNIGMGCYEPGEDDVKMTAVLDRGKVEDLTASPEREWEVQESSEVTGKLIQEDVQAQSDEILDEYVVQEHEENQMDSNECEEHDMAQEATYQSSVYDSKEETNCKDNNEAGKDLEDPEPVEKEVDKSIDGIDGTGRQEEACSWGETEMPEDSDKKLEDFQTVEETCTDELQERVQAAELFTREDNTTVEHLDVKSISTVGIIEVADDTSEHDEFLVLKKNKEACLHDESSQSAQHLGSSCGEERKEQPATKSFDPMMNAEQLLFFTKNEEACLRNEISQHAPQLGSSSRGEERVEEPAICPPEPMVKVEQPVCSQTATLLVGEDMCEQRSCFFEVDDEIIEDDEYFPAMDHIYEQDQPSMWRNEDDTGCDDTDQYPQDMEHTTFGKDRIEESTNTSSETKGNLEQPRTVFTVNDLIKKEMDEHTGCSIDVADETVDHKEKCPTPADACNMEVHSCLTGDRESYDVDDGNENTQDVGFSFEDERVTASVAVNLAEPEWKAEQLSSAPAFAKLIGEDMNETSVPARDREDFEAVEEETEDTCEVLPDAAFQNTQCETNVDFEQKHANAETFASDFGTEIQGDEAEVSADMGDVDVAGDQDIRMHDVGTSYKRKRWFQNRDETGEFHWSSILLGAKLALDLDQEDTQGFKVDDRGEIHVDERVNECGESTNVRQTDACISLEDSCSSTEATHRRRRWFEKRGQEVLHKTSVFDGVGTATQLDDEITAESELDDSLQTCADQLVNEGKGVTDGRGENLGRDQVESRASAEAAHRRRRWFENGEKLRPVQEPSIQEEETVKGEDTGKDDELGEMSTASFMENKQQNQMKSREKEKERERIAVERAIREARQRAFAEARERAAADARQKAAVAAQDKQGKDSSEAKSGSDKASMDAKLRAERAAVERATAEARERALQKAMSEKTAYRSKEKDSKSQTSGTSCSSGYSSAPFATTKSSGILSESPQRRKAISERNRRTMERAAKALEEKNLRDSLVQKEQAERNRFADALDADVKRWLTGKDGNLCAMLSTLQYILGPDSGWQPIPLTDLGTSTAVRKAYKKAALCVHPDKLQQRGATIQHKYICEKVFDLLKDAWQKYNPDD